MYMLIISFCIVVAFILIAGLVFVLLTDDEFYRESKVVDDYFEKKSEKHEKIKAENQKKSMYGFSDFNEHNFEKAKTKARLKGYSRFMYHGDFYDCRHDGK